MNKDIWSVLVLKAIPFIKQTVGDVVLSIGGQRCEDGKRQLVWVMESMKEAYEGK